MSRTLTANDLEQAFERFLCTGQVNPELAEYRALSKGTNTAGGWLVPDGFYDKIHDRLKAFGGIASLAEEITTSNGRPLPFPTVDDTSNVGELVAEGGASSSGADLVVNNRTLAAFKYMAGGSGNVPLLRASRPRSSVPSR